MFKWIRYPEALIRSDISSIKLTYVIIYWGIHLMIFPTILLTYKYLPCQAGSILTKENLNNDCKLNNLPPTLTSKLNVITSGHYIVCDANPTKFISENRINIMSFTSDKLPGSNYIIRCCPFVSDYYAMLYDVIVDQITPISNLDLISEIINGPTSLMVNFTIEVKRNFKDPPLFSLFMTSGTSYTINKPCGTKYNDTNLAISQQLPAVVTWRVGKQTETVNAQITLINLVTSSFVAYQPEFLQYLISSETISNGPFTSIFLNSSIIISTTSAKAESLYICLTETCTSLYTIIGSSLTFITLIIKIYVWIIKNLLRKYCYQPSECQMDVL